jgi:hypothetical protein
MKPLVVTVIAGLLGGVTGLTFLILESYHTPQPVGIIVTRRERIVLDAN